jgi:predicted DNA-binding transcriptional regulator AlpA
MRNTPAPAEQPLLLRERQVLALFGFTRSHFRNLLAAGRVPAPIRLGKHWVAWRRSDLERWLADGCPTAAAPG